MANLTFNDTADRRLADLASDGLMTEASACSFIKALLKASTIMQFSTVRPTIESPGQAVRERIVLSPRVCEYLQGEPDGYNSRLYQALGNVVSDTVDHRLIYGVHGVDGLINLSCSMARAITTSDDTEHAMVLVGDGVDAAKLHEQNRGLEYTPMHKVPLPRRIALYVPRPEDVCVDVWRQVRVASVREQDNLVVTITARIGLDVSKALIGRIDL